VQHPLLKKDIKDESLKTAFDYVIYVKALENRKYLILHGCEQGLDAWIRAGSVKIFWTLIFLWFIFLDVQLLRWNGYWIRQQHHSTAVVINTTKNVSRNIENIQWWLWKNLGKLLENTHLKKPQTCYFMQ
jgi:hypothetical protein